MGLEGAHTNTMTPTSDKPSKPLSITSNTSKSLCARCPASKEPLSAAVLLTHPLHCPSWDQRASQAKGLTDRPTARGCVVYCIVAGDRRCSHKQPPAQQGLSTSTENSFPFLCGHILHPALLHTSASQAFGAANCNGGCLCCVTHNIACCTLNEKRK